MGDMSMLVGTLSGQFSQHLQDFRIDIIQYLDILGEDINRFYKGTDKKEKNAQLKKFKYQILKMQDMWILQAVFLEHMPQTQQDMKVNTMAIAKLSGYNRSTRKGILAKAEASPFQAIRTGIRTIEWDIATKRRILANKDRDLTTRDQLSKNTEGIIYTSFDQLVQEARTNVARSPEEKVHRMHTRLGNILQGTIEQRHIDEVVVIKDRIQKMEGSNDSSVVELGRLVIQLADGIMEAGVDTIEEKSESNKVASKGSDIVVIPSPENNQGIEYLRYIRAEVLTYKLSSKKGGESIGDGNFIAYIWRPFLALFESGLKSGKIDAQSFSWKEVVGNIYATHDGIKGRVRLQAFLDILGSGVNPNGNLLQNWTILIDIIQEFSMNSGFYRKENGVVPLSNFLEALKNNPPLSR